jgi:DHA1 family bicyclomycin/chloramphenicol resistance-like MFS transporter
MASTALAIDFSLPAFPDVRAEFGMAADSTKVGWLITAFFLGMSVGPWLYGPLSDRFGRRPPLFAGLALYLLCAVVAPFVPTWGLLVATRFVWGLGSAATRTLCMAMIRDRYEGDAMAHAMSMIMAVFLIVPVVAPSLSAVLIRVTDWRIVFWVPAGVAVLLMLWARRLPETHLPERRRPLTWQAVGDAGRQVVRSREAVAFTLAVTFLLGVLYVFIAGLEVIVGDVYDRASWFPVIFGVIGMLFALSSLNNARLVQRIGLVALVRRLAVLSSTGGVVFALVAVTTGGRPNLLVFVMLLTVVLGGVQGLITNCNTAALIPLAGIAGTGSAIITTVSTAGGSMLANAANAAFDGTVTPFVVLIAAYVLVSTAFVYVGSARRTGRDETGPLAAASAASS